MGRWLPTAIVVVTAAKVATAWRLDLFGDEAFYWQCGQRLALSYADHPPVTAILVRLSSELFGDTPIGVRAFFLALGTLLPIAIYWLASPLVGARDARLAAALSLTIPATALVGLIAIPDVPLLVLDAFFLAAMSRALRQGSLRWWLLVGATGCLGFATHYRFAIAALAVGVNLVVDRRAGLLRRPGPWVAMALMLVGLAPAAWYNLRSSLDPIRYYLTRRHGATFTPEAWLDHGIGQLLLVSPLLYLLLLVSLSLLVRVSLERDRSCSLLAIFSIAHLGLYFLAIPFEQSSLATEHWPIPGYLPLLVYAPAVIRTWAERGGWRRRFVWCAPILGMSLVCLTLLELATGRLHLGSIREQFVGWSEAVAGGRKHLLAVEPRSADGRWIVVADNYKLGANLEVALHEKVDVYVLDHHKNRQHGRAQQLETWRIGEHGLRDRQGEEALVVVEATQIRRGEHESWMEHVGGFFIRLEPLGEVIVPSPGKRKKEKVYRYYRGIGITKGWSR